MGTNMNPQYELVLGKQNIVSHFNVSMGKNHILCEKNLKYQSVFPFLLII